MAELSEKQVRASVRATVRKAVSDAGLKGVGITLEECIKRSEKALDEELHAKDSFWKRRIPKGTGGMLSDFVRSAESIIRDEAERAYRRACASGRVRDISVATAKAVCSRHLCDEGFSDFGFTVQTYRLKVWASLPSGRKLHFSIRYRHLEEDLSNVKDGLRTALHLAGLFDRDTTIR